MQALGSLFMFNRVCKNCGNSFRFEDVEIEERRSKWAHLQIACRCPHCKAELPNVRPDSVDLAKHLKLKYVLPFLLFFVVFALSIVFNILNYTSPLMVAIFGVWLAKTAKFKDHRIIGWFLIIVALLLLWFLSQ